MTKRLSENERQLALSELSGWTLEAGRDAIRKSFTFSNFSQAWGTMTRIALAAEQTDHHPEWFNVYNRLDIVLTTHDAGGLSHKDIVLAKTIDQIVENKKTS